MGNSASVKAQKQTARHSSDSTNSAVKELAILTPSNRHSQQMYTLEDFQGTKSTDEPIRQSIIGINKSFDNDNNHASSVKLVPSMRRHFVEDIMSPFQAQAVMAEPQGNIEIHTQANMSKKQKKTSSKRSNNNSLQVPESVKEITTPHFAQAYMEKDRELSTMTKTTGNLNTGIVSVVQTKTNANKFVESKRKRQQKEETLMLEQHPELKDTIHEVGELLKGIENDKEPDAIRNAMSIKTMNALKQIYDFYFDFETKIHQKLIGDHLAKCNAGYLFTEYMKILDSKATPSSYHVSCVYLLRSVCWNYSDASIAFAEELARMGMVQIITDSLVKVKNNYKDDKDKEFVVLSGLSTLHNIAKSANNVKYYKEKKVMDTIIFFSKEKSSELNIISMITLAYIVDESNNDIITADGSIIDDIILLTKRTLSTATHTAEGFSSTELLIGLRKLAGNGNNSIVIVEKGILLILEDLLEKGSDEEKECSARFAWVLSFNEENKNKIKSNQNLMELLASFANTEPNSETGKAAAGTLWVLRKQPRQTLDSIQLQKKRKVHKKIKEKAQMSPPSPLVSGGVPPPPPPPGGPSVSAERTSTRTPRPQPPPPLGTRGTGPSPTSSSSIPTINEEQDEAAFSDEEGEFEQSEVDNLPLEGGHVMISYQWDNQRLLLRIKDVLEKLGYKMWMDVDQMSGSTLQAMADAVENASVVLVCMSQKYKNSPNCRTEAEYAYQLNKSIIPILVENEYKPDGWLGAIKGSKFYFDFTSLNQFDKLIEKLSRELGERGKNREIIMKTDAQQLSSPPQAGDVFKHPGTWDKTDIRKWVQENNIHSAKMERLEGSSLLFLSTLRIQAPEFYFRYLHDQLDISTLRDLMVVSAALDKLRTQTLN